MTTWTGTPQFQFPSIPSETHIAISKLDENVRSPPSTNHLNEFTTNSSQTTLPKMLSLQASYHYESVIGTGGSAKVFRARHKNVPVRVAIKCIDGESLMNENDRTRIVNEITIFKQMDHPFIAKLFFATTEGDGYALVQEYVPNRSLLDLIHTYGPLPENQSRHYFLQLISAVEYLHSIRRVAHRDLKLENILLDRYKNIKVVDFGFSHIFPTDEYYFTTLCGSEAYLAPELIRTGKYTHTADIWALGIILFAMATATLPFHSDDQHEMFQLIATSPIYYPYTLSENLIDLLSKMLCRNPKKRISLQEIKDHPWFPSQYYDTLMEAINANPKINEMNDEILGEMTGNGIDCSRIAEAIKLGEETEETILYNIYLRQKQNDALNFIMRTSIGNGIPVFKPGGPTIVVPAIQMLPKRYMEGHRTGRFVKLSQQRTQPQRRVIRPDILSVRA
jgi:serine/threonine protein kinase